MQSVSELKRTGFSDLFIEAKGAAWFKRATSERGRRHLSGAEMREVEDLRAALSHNGHDTDFRVEWGGMSLRVARITSIHGDVYIVRRLLEQPIPFGELGYPARIAEALMSESFLRGGVVLFTGSTGAGKSASLSSWLVARLQAYGGTAWTVENPAEIALQGVHGAGICYQTEVRDDAEFGTAIRQMLRAAPNLLMVGEIRSAEATMLSVQAGTSGHLLGATLHGNDLPTSLERVAGLLREAGQDRALLADGLSAVIHQSLTITTSPEGRSRYVLNVNPLIVSGAFNESAIRSVLRKGDFSQLASELNRQRNLMLSPTSNVAL